MTNQENSAVPSDFAESQTAVLENVAGSQEENQTTNDISQNESKQSDAALNFKRLREANERLEREREQDRQMMMAMQEELLKRNQLSQQAPQIDEFADLDKSDWSTIAQTEKLAARIADERFERKWAEAEARRKAEELPSRLISRYNDFNQVVNKENVQQLRDLDPDLAHALSLISDEEKKAIATYKYIKKFVPQSQGSSSFEATQKMQQNEEKPKSLSSTGGGSPLNNIEEYQMRKMSDDFKNSIYQEMMAFAKKGR